MPSSNSGSSLSRRRFLQASTTTLASLGFGLRAGAEPGSPASASPPRSSDRLQGFVVSDAHFGWANPQQPSPAQIQAAMQSIMRRFPALDVLLDTGDATHSYGTDLDRANWMEIVQGGCGRLPFHFVTGNHDQAGPWYVVDPEHHVQTLGSLSCRPFYSFDLKNIHFVALPQLMVVSLVTHEAMEWLRLDLELNKDKTTLVFSHNALRDTTWKADGRGDNTYRLVANSDEIRALFRRYPNVKGWLHGHNHDFVVAEKESMLFVSNGRIGGFDPHKNSPIAGSLGGFWFEVSPDSLTVRAYDGSKSRFLDEVPGFESLHHTLQCKTSLNVAAPAAISFGSGNALDGQRWPVYNHYALADNGSQEVFLQASARSVINNDPAFTGFLEGRRGRTSPGFHVVPVREGRAGRRGQRKGKTGVEAEESVDAVDRTWEFLNPGIRFLRLADASIVRHIQCPGQRGTRSNWRCVPGRTYRVTLDLEATAAGPTVQLFAAVLDPDYSELESFTSGPPVTLAGGVRQVSFEFTVPPLKDLETIYNDPALDATCYVTVEAAIGNLVADVVVRQFALAPAGVAAGEAEVYLNGARFAAAGQAIARHELKAAWAGRSTLEVTAPGVRSLTWLVRQTGLAFQLRNATIEDKGDYLQVTRLRNKFSQQEEIIFAPLTEISVPFVHRLRHVNRARVYHWDAKAGVLRIEPEEVFGGIGLDVVMAEQPARVTGADMWKHADGLLRVWARGILPIEIFRGAHEGASQPLPAKDLEKSQEVRPS